MGRPHPPREALTLRALALSALLILGLPAATKLALNTAPPAQMLRIEDWLGVWRDGQNVVWISLNPDNQVTVVSAAYTDAPVGKVTHATLQFQTPVAGDQISFVTDTAPCAADFRNSRGKELTVTDNGQCGAVRFNGVYLKQ